MLLRLCKLIFAKWVSYFVYFIFFLNRKVETSFLTVRKIGGAELTGAGDL